MAVDSRAEQRVRPVLAVFGVLLAGIVAGILAKESDNWSSWTRYLTSYGGFWLVAVTMLGATAPGLRAAAGRTAVFLLAMVVGYYATYDVTEGNLPLRFLALWASAGVTVGPWPVPGSSPPARRPVEPR